MGDFGEINGVVLWRLDRPLLTRQDSEKQTEEASKANHRGDAVAYHAKPESALNLLPFDHRSAARRNAPLPPSVHDDASKHQRGAKGSKNTNPRIIGVHLSSGDRFKSDASGGAERRSKFSGAAVSVFAYSREAGWLL